MTDLSRRSFFQLLGAAIAVASIPAVAQAAITPAALASSPGDIELLIDGVWKRLGKAVNVEFESSVDYREIESAFSDHVIRQRGLRDERGKIVFEIGKFGDFDSALAAAAHHTHDTVRLRAHVGDGGPIEVNTMLMAYTRNHRPDYMISTAEIDFVVFHT